MKTYPIIIASCALLAGCATGYHKLTPLALTGGFKEKDLGRNVWRMTFSANGYTTRETAQCFWLYRCAELTLEKGFDGFEVLSDIRLAQSVPVEKAFGSNESEIQQAVFVPIIIPMDESYKPNIEGDIVLLKGPTNARPPKVFDARKLKAALRPHVEKPMKSGGNVKPHVHDYLLPEHKLGSST
jgi:hypothetical protein